MDLRYRPQSIVLFQLLLCVTPDPHALEASFHVDGYVRGTQ